MGGAGGNTKPRPPLESSGDEIPTRILPPQELPDEDDDDGPTMHERDRDDPTMRAVVDPYELAAQQSPLALDAAPVLIARPMTPQGPIMPVKPQGPSAPVKPQAPIPVPVVAAPAPAMAPKPPAPRPPAPEPEPEPSFGIFEPDLEDPSEPGTIGRPFRQ